MNSQQLKAKGKYWEAGKAAFREGKSDYYGCHFGMRSNREAAIAAFRAGWAEAKREAK